jgi:hypothetical protein
MMVRRVGHPTLGLSIDNRGRDAYDLGSESAENFNFMHDGWH